VLTLAGTGGLRAAGSGGFLHLGGNLLLVRDRSLAHDIVVRPSIFESRPRD
jgi:hypothetical protein